MTPEQIQTAKEVLEAHGYVVVITNDHIAMTNRNHDVFKIRHVIRHVKEEDKIYIVPAVGFFLAGQIKREFAFVYEVMIDLNLNGVPVAM
uniref:Uncharacterized protein n=1 Tax=viral metagenome TaxID=1070528 RepID=A0A6M3JS76_9ZZZZ